MSLYSSIIKGIPETVRVPPEMEAIVDWYEKSEDFIGGLFEFYSDKDKNAIECWFGNDLLRNRFGVFGMMPDGSLVAFWISDSKEQKIIMLGSEGDSQLILADNFLNFIKLVAIGYNEFTYTDFSQTIEKHNKSNEEDSDYGVNPKFQNWFTNAFQTTIPKTGIEIINHEDDSFAKWVEKQFE